MYVYNVLDSCETTQETQPLLSELSDGQRKGGFNLRKKSSNKPAVLKEVPFEEKSASLQIEDENRLAGVLWNAEDVFTFKVDIREIKGNLTKRSVLSAIATLFDPLQCLAPL